MVYALKKTYWVAILSLFVFLNPISGHGGYLGSGFTIGYYEPSIKAGLVLSSMYAIGALVRYMSIWVANELIEPETSGEVIFKKSGFEVPRKFKPSGTVIIECFKNNLLDRFEEAGIDQAAIDSYMKSFQAGLQFPLMMDFLAAASNIYSDIGMPTLSFMHELLLSTLENISFSVKGAASGFEASEYRSHDLEYPLAHHHSTALFCGRNDPHCLGDDAHHVHTIRDHTSSHAEALVLNFYRLLIGLGIEVTGITLGGFFGLVAYTLGTILLRQFQSQGINPYLGGARASSTVARLIAGYCIDIILLESSKSTFLSFAEYCMPKHDSSEALLKSEDAKAAHTFGQKASEIVLRSRFSAERIMKIQTPVAKFITQLMYGPRTS